MVRSGRWRHGSPITDDEYQQQLAEAARQRLEFGAALSVEENEIGQREEVAEEDGEEECEEDGCSERGGGIWGGRGRRRE